MNEELESRGTGAGALESVVGAEVVEDGIMLSNASFDIDMSIVQRDIEELTLAIDEALTVYGELLVAPETIGSLEPADAQRCERAVSSAIRAANEARLQLGRDYRVPLDLAKQRYDELMGPVIELHAAYKQRRVQLADEERESKRCRISAIYEGMASDLALPAAGQDAPLVPFDRIFDAFGAKWLNKGSSLESIERELAGIVERLRAGERKLDEAGLAHPLEAKAVFWATFDAEAALARDRELSELEQAQAAREEQRKLEGAQASQPMTAGADAAATDPAEAAPARKPRVMLIDGATDDECRQIARLCKQLGITGVFKGERFYEQALAIAETMQER